jgi:hypothetical protein
MVRVLLVIQMPDASDKRSVALRFRPIDCLFLSFESAELVVRIILDYIILDSRPFRAALRTGFDINVRHGLFSLILLSNNPRKLHEGQTSAKYCVQHTCFIVALANRHPHCFTAEPRNGADIVQRNLTGAVTPAVAEELEVSEILQ